MDSLETPTGSAQSAMEPPDPARAIGSGISSSAAGTFTFGSTALAVASSPTRWTQHSRDVMGIDFLDRKNVEDVGDGFDRNQELHAAEMLLIPPPHGPPRSPS